MDDGERTFICHYLDFGSNFGTFMTDTLLTNIFIRVKFKTQIRTYEDSKEDDEMNDEWLSDDEVNLRQ